MNGRLYLSVGNKIQREMKTICLNINSLISQREKFIFMQILLVTRTKTKKNIINGEIH